MKHSRYVEFVVEFVTTDGKYKATRRMSKRGFIARMACLILLSMLIGVLAGIKIWSELQ